AGRIPGSRGAQTERIGRPVEWDTSRAEGNSTGRDAQSAVARRGAALDRSGDRADGRSQTMCTALCRRKVMRDGDGRGDEAEASAEEPTGVSGAGAGAEDRAGPGTGLPEGEHGAPRQLVGNDPAGDSGVRCPARDRGAPWLSAACPWSISGPWSRRA